MAGLERPHISRDAPTRHELAACRARDPASGQLAEPCGSYPELGGAPTLDGVEHLFGLRLRFDC
jgi:hypothetical protein